MNRDRQNVSSERVIQPLRVKLRATMNMPPGDLDEFTHQGVNQSWFGRPRVAEILVCAATALVYLATLWFGFVYDDVLQVFKSPALHEWRYLPQYFSSHVLAAIHPGAGGNYYRPLLLLWLRLNYVLFGPEPAGWHATTVLCHMLATFLVFQLAVRLSRDRLMAFETALLFGITPSHIESVAWISGVSDPLMTCFLLGSLLMFLEWRSGRRFGAAIWSLALFACALLSKETAVVLPALIFAAEIARPTDGSCSRTVAKILGGLRKCAGFVVVTIGYFGVRLRALQGWSHPEIQLTWKQVLLTWPGVIWFYARHLIWPVGLSEFYPLEYVSNFTARGVVMPLAWLCVCAGAMALTVSLIRDRSRKKIGGFAIALMTIPLLPVLDLRALTPGDVVHDRYLYLPSAGFALLVGLLIGEVAGRVCEVDGWRGVDSKIRVRLAAVVASMVVITMAALTISQQMQWASDILLYTRGLQSAPANLNVRDNLANALMGANQPERAIPLYLEVLERNPLFWRSNYNLGYAYYKSGNFAGAEEYLGRAIKIDPNDADEYIYLAITELQLKNMSGAVENARRAIALNPHARGYHWVAGMAYEGAGNITLAAAEFRTEVAEHPDNAAAVAALQKLQGAAPER